MQAIGGLTSSSNKFPMFSGSGSATLIDLKDEDDMASNSTTAVPTQQSVKAYIEPVAEGLHIKDSCRVATTTSGTLSSSFEDGDTIDGITLSTGDRILIKDQVNGVENGIYTVNASGAPSRGSGMIGGDNASSDFTFISEGTINGNHGFVCTSDNNSATVGTHSLTFTQFSGAGQITAGEGLNKSGNTIYIDLNEYNSITPTNGDHLLTLDSDNSTGQLTDVSALATLFAGNGLQASNSVLSVNLASGDIPDNAANTSGSSGSCTGNSATATTATNINANANNSTDETVYLTFVDGATGTQGIETDTGLTYNPSSGIITTTSLVGNVTGNFNRRCYWNSI